jgi:hypothetical protein
MRTWRGVGVRGGAWRGVAWRGERVRVRVRAHTSARHRQACIDPQGVHGVPRCMRRRHHTAAHLAVKAARAQQRGVEQVCPVGGTQEHHACTRRGAGCGCAVDVWCVLSGGHGIRERTSRGRGRGRRVTG